MTIEINLELSDADLAHFKQLMQEAIQKNSGLSEDEVLEKAQAVVSQMEQSNQPDFVKSRVSSLADLIAAVKDEEWQMPEDEKKDILTSLIYFSEPQDLVPDDIPVLGFLDDAIMIELVIQDMSLDLRSYRQFCSFRRTEEKRRGDAAKVDRDSWLAGTRSEIRAAMRKDRKASSKRSFFRRIM
ncbi:YkvA family protein [Planctobacterium marinum]|uniref:YkvA family protein n=1 Tax=Planctobacterium marinum TaxID=1631968 RepID=UPI001E65C3CE|nr:YkvA family protein [Planctobacterium marinum]MCC2605470.1 DUF1232 domain-containing protein [Planctobacterium marinum]